jgi:hypothetical protein
MFKALASLLLMAPLASCLAGAAIGATGAVVGAAVGVTGAVVGAAVKTTGAVIDAATPGDDHDDEEDDH